MGDFDDINVKINVDASGAEQGLTRVSTSLNKLNSDVGKLGTGADFGDKLNSEAKQAEGGLDKLGEAAEQANQKLAKVGSGLNLSAIGSQLDALSGKMQAWGAGLSILAAPFELVGAASVNAFSDFEAGMGKIFTLLPDITEKGMSEMSAQIKNFATTFGADLSTVQQAAYDALSSGVSQADLMPFLETAQTAAVAGMSDVGTAVDGLTSAINAYQMELDDAGRVSDVFFKTVELGKIEFDELSRNIGKVAPTAAQFGISIEDTGAAIAAITSQGVSAEETMTGLKNLFKDVATPGTQLNKIFQEISGVTFKDFIANGGTLSDAVSKLRDYSNQTGKSFFEMGSTFESANTLAMLGGGFFDKYAEMTEKVGSAAGSTESAYGKMSDTMAVAIDKLKSQFQVMSVDIGEKLAPVVLEFTEWLTENADKISDFAQNVASAAVPAIESIFDTLQKGMDMYDNMSPETKAMLAKLIGVGAVGAAVAGPGLLIGGTALSQVASIVKLLGSLKVPATVATEVGAIGTAASTATGAGGVGALTTALAALGGPVTLGAIAGVGLAIGAWETDFMGVRTTALDSAEAIFAGFQNAVSSSLEFIGGAAPAISEAFWGALSDPDYESQLIPNLQAVLAEATDTAELEGRAAAAAWIDNWNAEIASGRIKAPDIPDSQTASRTNTGIPVDIPPGMAVVNGTYQPIPIGASVVNGTVYSTGAAQYGEDQKKLNELFAQFPTQQALATQTGTENAAPEIAEQTGNSVAEALAKSKGWYYMGKLDVQMAQEFLRKNPGYDVSKLTGATPTGTTSDPLVATTTTPTSSTPAATTASPGTFERPSGNIPDLFTTDPARYVQQELKPILEGGFDGSIAAYESYLREFGMTLEDKTKQIFTDAKSKGFGGGVDWDDWLPKAMKAFDKTGTEAKTTIPQINTLNSSLEKIGLTGSGLTDVLSSVNQALSDHHANIQEAQDYLKQYNAAAGENVKYTKSQEGQTKDLMNSLGMLGTAQNMYNQYMSDGVLDATESAHVQEALAAAMKMMGDAGIDANTNLAGLPGALQALASAAQAAMNQIQSAISNSNTVVQNAQTTAANIFKFGQPYTPGAMPASQLSIQHPVGFDNLYGGCSFKNQVFASGGPVTQNGPAYLHQGEYVLRRDEVGRLTSGGTNVNLNINMSNSRFGSSELQKDLPKRIARETRRALARSGV